MQNTSKDVTCFEDSRVQIHIFNKEKKIFLIYMKINFVSIHQNGHCDAMVIIIINIHLHGDTPTIYSNFPVIPTAYITITMQKLIEVLQH